jgi:hypothetical protein
VSLAIVQRYIEPILAKILSQNAGIQASAMDILSFTVRQGLAHPMQACFFCSPRCSGLTELLSVSPRSSLWRQVRTPL